MRTGIFFHTNYLDFLIVGALVFVSLLTPSPAQSQVILDPNLLGGQLVLEATPRTPPPNSVVLVRVQSFSIDLNRSIISWYTNRGLKQRGFGLTELSLPLENASVEVEVVVQSESGALFRESTVIQPASVDILWEAESYTPPFYRGKALFGIGTRARISALPAVQNRNGTYIPPEDLIFTWKQGSRVLGNLSGRGKDSISLDGYVFSKALDVRVEVETLEGTLVAENQQLIVPVQPFVALYENHPTRGVRLERMLTSPYRLFDEEITLVAEPYYFDTQNNSSPILTYNWQINNETAQNPNENQSLITLRPTAGNGSARIGLSLTHGNRILQQAGSELDIQFSAVARDPTL